MTLDHQIINQTLKRPHPPASSGALLVQNGYPTPDFDAGFTGNPITKLLTFGKEDNHAEWHMENIIEDIIGMESSFKEEGTDSLLMQRPRISHLSKQLVFTAKLQKLDYKEPKCKKHSAQ